MNADVSFSYKKLQFYKLTPNLIPFKAIDYLIYIRLVKLTHPIVNLETVERLHYFYVNRFSRRLVAPGAARFKRLDPSAF